MKFLHYTIEEFEYYYVRKYLRQNYSTWNSVVRGIFVDRLHNSKITHEWDVYLLKITDLSLIELESILNFLKESAAVLPPEASAAGNPIPEFQQLVNKKLETVTPIEHAKMCRLDRLRLLTPAQMQEVLNYKDKLFGETALHFAVKRRKPEVAQFLLEQKANANATDRYGLTPLAEICSRFRWEWQEKSYAEKSHVLVQLLAKYTTDLNTPLAQLISSVDVNSNEIMEEQTPILTAIVKALASVRAVDREPILAKATDEKWMESLEPSVDTFLKNRASESEVNLNTTLENLIVSFGEKNKARKTEMPRLTALVKALTSAGAISFNRDAQILLRAIMYCNTEIVTSLLQAAKAKGRVNYECFIKDGSEGLIPIYTALNAGQDEIVKLLLNSGVRMEVNQTVSDFEIMPLHVVINCKDPTAMAKLLVEHKADVKKADAMKNFLLPWFNTWSSDEHHKPSEELVRFLLSQGADPNAVDPTKSQSRVTALFCALTCESESMIRCLIEGGADIDLVPKARYLSFREYLLKMDANDKERLKPGIKNPDEFIKEMIELADQVKAKRVSSPRFPFSQRQRSVTESTPRIPPKPIIHPNVAASIGATQSEEPVFLSEKFIEMDESVESSADTQISSVDEKDNPEEQQDKSGPGKRIAQSETDEVKKTAPAVNAVNVKDVSAKFNRIQEMLAALATSSTRAAKFEELVTFLRNELSVAELILQEQNALAADTESFVVMLSENFLKASGVSCHNRASSSLFSLNILSADNYFILLELILNKMDTASARKYGTMLQKNRNGYHPLFEVLLSPPPELLLRYSQAGNERAKHFAALKKIIKLYRSIGLNMKELRDSEGNTALHIVIKSHNFNLIDDFPELLAIPNKGVGAKKAEMPLDLLKSMSSYVNGADEGIAKINYLLRNPRILEEMEGQVKHPLAMRTRIPM